MPNKSSRFIALIALLVGALIGWLVKPAPGLEQPPPCSGDAVIRVGLDGNVNRPTVTLDKEKHEVAFWVSADRTNKLLIEFEQNAPFEGMEKETNGRWKVHCESRTCFSGDISKEAQGEYESYKYWQVLENKDGKRIIEVDGHIIIKP